MNYMAVVAGLKPLLDDGIPVKSMDAFAAACGKYGLRFRTEAVFLKEATDEELEFVEGGERLNTTKWFGARYNPSLQGGYVHVFVAKSEDAIEMGYRAGWYPLIIGSVSFEKPIIDHFRFGAALGVPECCNIFFMKENPKRNFLFTVLKNTRGMPHYLCNCLTKDNVYSYTYHMPCSFNCAETIRYAEALREEVKKREPRFAAQIDFRLKTPFLVFEEQFIYAFDGYFTDFGTISYKRAFFVGNLRNDRFSDLLNAANRLRILDNTIQLFNNDRMVGEIAEAGFLVCFGE
ncbi:MAG: hypothetical protein ABIH66_01510 [bacterium]